MTPVEILGGILAAVTLLAGVFVVTSKVPIHAACFLILTLCGVAATYVVLEAHTLAVLQILVYAGAIVVLIVFVLMLLGSGPKDTEEVKASVPVLSGGALAMTLLAIFGVSMFLERDTVAAANLPASYGELEPIGRNLLGPYVFSFELISLLFMVAIIGAVALLRAKPAKTEEETEK